MFLFPCLCALQIKTQQKYIWGKRDVTEEGCSLLELTDKVRLILKVEEQWNLYTVTIELTPTACGVVYCELLIHGSFTLKSPRGFTDFSSVLKESRFLVVLRVLGLEIRRPGV